MGLNKEAFEAWLESNGDIEFDLYAQDSNAWYELADMIPGLIIASAGGMMPFQAEGLLQGYPFYFRAEWGYATLQVGARDGEKPYLPDRALWSATVNDVDALTEPEVHFEQLMLMLVPKLAPGPFLWRFRARKVHWLDDTIERFAYEITDEWEDDTVLGWGHTPEEGYAASQKPSAYLAEKGGFPLERQVELWVARDVQPAPTNVDDREYPAAMPAFRVTV